MCRFLWEALDDIFLDYSANCGDVYPNQSLFFLDIFVKFVGVVSYTDAYDADCQAEYC